MHWQTRTVAKKAFGLVRTEPFYTEKFSTMHGGKRQQTAVDGLKVAAPRSVAAQQHNGTGPTLPLCTALLAPRSPRSAQPRQQRSLRKGVFDDNTTSIELKADGKHDAPSIDIVKQAVHNRSALRQVTEALLQLLNGDGQGVLATVVRTQGSVPQPPGARLLLQPDNTYVGTVGGGAIEFEVKAAMQAIWGSSNSQVLSRDLGRDLGMCCGGKMEIFIEPIQASPKLWIFGAGHVAQPTAELATKVGFEVQIVDEREQWNCASRFARCQLHLQDPTSLLRRRKMSPDSDWLLIVTHDHGLDEETLRLALATKARYIGLVGSQRKVYRMLRAAALRLGPLPLERVYAPVGLDLGGTQTSEVAMSIVAELVALRHGTNAAPLRAMNDPRLLELLASACETQLPG